MFTLGLYSAFLAWSAIVFKSNLQSKLTVETIFCRVGTMPDDVVVVRWVVALRGWFAVFRELDAAADDDIFFLTSKRIGLSDLYYIIFFWKIQ